MVVVPVLRRRLVIAALAGLFLSGAVAGQEARTTAPAINRYCPVMPEEEVNPELTTTYQGYTVAFCCEKCLAKFTADPQRYAARLAGSTMGDDGSSAAATPHPSDHARPEFPHQAHGSAAAGQADERAHDEAHEHEHEHEPTAAGEARGAARLIAWLGKFHPPMVNFPIAMLLGAALAEWLWIGTRRPLFAQAGRFCLWVGALGAAMAGGLGWCFGGFHLRDDSWIMTTHRWLGTSTAAWSVLVLVLGERFRLAPTSRRRRAYRLALFAGAALVTVTGFFGGSLIYGLNHYAW